VLTLKVKIQLISISLLDCASTSTYLNITGGQDDSGQDASGQDDSGQDDRGQDDSGQDDSGQLSSFCQHIISVSILASRKRILRTSK